MKKLVYIHENHIAFLSIKTSVHVGLLNNYIIVVFMHDDTTYQ